MKYILLLFGLLFACTCRAQSPDIRYSDPLQISESLASRLVLCTNGNTLLFNFGQSVLAVDVYDTARRLVRQVSVPDRRITAAPLSSCKVRAVFPAGNEVLLFLQTGDGAGDSPLLRLAFNSGTGELLETAPVLLSGNEPAALREGAKRPAYSVRHDPASGAYAVACHTEYPGRGEQPVQICLYDKLHQRRAQSALARPGGDTYFCDMIVSDSVVWVASSTSIRSGDGAGFEYDARLTRLSGSDTSSVVLNRWKALEPVRMMLAYSGKDRSLRLVMHAETDSQGRRYGRLYTETQLASVDAGELRVAYMQPVTYEAVGVYRGNAFGLSLPFTGIPTDIFVDGAGRMELFCREYGGGMTYDLAVLQFDASGKPGAAFSARRANPVPGNASVGRLRRGELELLKGKIGEMAFDYIRTAEDRVILYNDHPDNVTRNQRAVPKILQHPPKARTTANSARRGRWHLFETGAEGSERGNRFADFESAAWDGPTATYAVLITDRAGLLKQQRVAWLRF